METAEVRRRVRDAIAAARRRGTERRQRIDEAGRAWTAVRERVLVPLLRQLAQALTAEGLRLQVSTPGESVVIGSEHRPDDRLELSLESVDEDGVVMMRAFRGREGLREERPLVRGAAGIEGLSEEQALEAVLTALGPWLAR